MSEHAASFWLTIVAYGSLLTCIITFTVTGDTTHAGEAFAALAGFVGGNVTRAPRAVTAAATIGLAGLVAVTMSGCGATLPAVVAGATMVIKPTCVVARAVSRTCDIVDPLPSNVPDPTPVTP